ncbi:hypothetical protein KC19_5G129500 [Ceratodon purpureus]|uniref:Uncharacterized protein n=1 Tax=Ceratodon purpureus TaxID=3225 RepID=A0A8T0I1T5_CERPU|nr:hypothetical protein KC19_5G129500 [Ceratodon purpureus]
MSRRTKKEYSLPWMRFLPSGVCQGFRFLGFTFKLVFLIFQIAIMGPMPSSGRVPAADVEMGNTEVKSRKRSKRRKVEWGDATDGEIEWAKSLSDCQLDLMVSVKQLAMERVRSTREKALNGLLTPAGLRAIGVILEEFMMDRVQTLRNAPDSPSVIDELRACIEKSEDETRGTNHVETAIETDEQS